MARDLSGQVYRQLKEDLIAERFPLDGLITEQMIADRYGVSKTPAREAATHLLYEGYLVKYPSKGYVMRRPTEQELQDITEYRFILECGVIERIIAQASDEQIKNLLFVNADSQDKDAFEDCFNQANLSFHLAMAELTGNHFIVEMLRTTLYLLVRPSVVRMRSSYNAYSDKHRSMNSPEHLELVQAMLERDYEKAKDCLGKDIYPIRIEE